MVKRHGLNGWDTAYRGCNVGCAAALIVLGVLIWKSIKHDDESLNRSKFSLDVKFNDLQRRKMYLELDQDTDFYSEDEYSFKKSKRSFASRYSLSSAEVSALRDEGRKAHWPKYHPNSEPKPPDYVGNPQPPQD